MRDFLTFQTFITPSLLILMYYIGALLIPVVSWYLAEWIKTSYFTEISKSIKEEIQTRTTAKQRFIVYTAFIICFLCMEIFWRMMFEFFIAYFDMHDALMKL
ncbi:DUF4282 domain-containing protein [Sulfurovum sp. CS9]|uniref:DUF4282 domain-containing protein n=1 Tax=Sulfurovum sp. CS9 TaxID=3391146 RepID=UPI0039EA1DB2